MIYRVIFISAAIILLFVLFMLVITLYLCKRIGKGSRTLKSDAAEGAGEGQRLPLEWKEQVGSDEIGNLVDSFTMMEEALIAQMNNVAAMAAERQKVQAELDVATRIQKNMLPDDFSEITEKGMCDIYGSMTPAKEVGGDFYDFFALDEDRLCIVIADVSGKGVPAALFMTISKIMIKQRAKAGGSPSQVLFDVNNQLCADNKEMLFVTVWLGIVDIKTGEVVYCNAGHEYPVIIHEGKSSLADDGPNDPPLALASDMPFTDRTMHLYPGDALFVYTDGVPEAKRGKKERYGTERMLVALDGQRADTPCEKVIRALEKNVDSFTMDKEPFDDITMLMLRLKKVS